MNKEKLTIEATIPTVQYGNVKPTIEMEGDNFDEMRDLGLKRIKAISDMVAGEGYTFDVRGLTVPDGSKVISTLKTSQNVPETLTSELTGVVALYDADRHVYTNMSTGVKMLSGSKFPDRFYEDFDSKAAMEMILKAYPDAKGHEAQILKMWKLNSRASTDWGHAVHTALENFDKNREIGLVIRGYEDKEKTIFKPNKAFNRNPILKKIVEDFQVIGGEDDVMAEPFIASDVFNICGQIDRLKFVDREKKIVRIQDYKTDVDILEKKYQKKTSPFKDKILNEKGKPDNTQITYHRFQLSFYAFILQQYGYTVEGTDLFWLNPNKLLSGENVWDVFSHDVIDLSEVIING